MYEPLPIDRVLAAVLPEGSLFAVGGRVRDEVRETLGGTPAPRKDLDYVVAGVHADALRRRLERVARVDLVGASFAVFKVTVQGRTVDVSLPRREHSVGSGHREFMIESGSGVTLYEDLSRRDFRMNMIARALPGGALIDPCGGEADIRARRIDIINAKTFEEDPLRMLRAAQFAARFRYDLSDAAKSALAASAHLIVTVSAERIADELAKMLTLAQQPSIGLDLLHETGALRLVLPEIVEGDGVEQNEWHAYDVYRHNLATMDAAAPEDLMLRLAALFHDIGKPRTKDGPHFYRHEQIGAQMTREALTRLRFPGETTQTAEHLVLQHMYVADPELSGVGIRRFIRRIGVAHLGRQFALRAADIAGSGLPRRDDSNERFQARVYAEVERRPAFSVRDLRIDGAAVIACMIRMGLESPGFQGDKRVGDALRHLFEQVTQRPERNEPSTLQGLLERYLDAR